MLRIQRILTRANDKRQAVLSLNLTQKIILVAVCATVPLWLGLARAHSAPAAAASPATFTAIPKVKLENVPAEALIGEQFKFKVTFDNVGTDVGYGPFIDVVLPAGGKDLDNFFPATTTHGPCDGISANMSSTLDVMMVNVIGGPLPVKTYKHLTIPCGTDGSIVTHPYSGSGISPVVVPLGAQLLTLELPFGSFEPDQPKIEVEITVDLHNFADVGLANKLTIYARGGFRFGTTPLNDHLTDQPIVTDSGVPSYDNGTTPSISSTWTEQKDVTPTVFTISKTYLGPEGEAVSGPNFVGYYPLRYQVTVNVANQQTVTNLVVNDCLENNMSFVGLASPTTTGYTNLQTTPCLQMTYGSIVGTGSAADVVVTYEFYITKSVGTSNTPVLDPEACGNTTSTNQATASGQWMPLDPRDVGLTPMTVSSSTKYVLADKHIAIQKSVTVKVRKKTTLVDKNDLPIPGDYLEYKMRFQISDFFTFGQIEIEDHLSDGQDLIQVSPALPASFRVTDQFGTVTGNFVDTGANADLAFGKTGDLDCQGVPGGTRILFKVSQAMMNNTSLSRLNQGIMTGGYALSTSSPIPAEGEITFYVQIQDEFTYQPDKKKKFVDKDDPMNNCVVIRGRIYDNTDDKEPKPRANDDSVCSDGSGTSVMIKPDVFKKEIIARNGMALTAASGVPPKYAAGDTITFRLSKTIPSGDWENLTIQDWGPLPVLDTNTLNLSSTISSCGGNYPATGNICFGLNDDVGQPTGPTGMTHHLDNSFTLDYGTQDNTANTPKTIDLWFTLTLTNKPFADGLYLTNEGQECEFNTFGTMFCQVAVAQFELTEPSLRITKGVVWAGNPNTNPSAVFNPTQSAPPGVVFSGPGACPRFTGTIRSATLGSTISSDVSGVDAGDLVLFAIVVENQGSGLNGAFDVKVRDTLPSGLTLVTSSPICVTYGDGVAILNSGGPTLFGPDLELNDISSTQGALGPKDLSATSNGHNIAVITFYAQVDTPINTACYPNKAELLNYATTEGGPNFVSPAAFGGPFTDVANVCVLPKAEKCVVATSEPHTQPDNSIVLSPPQPPKVAIGEIVRYRLKVALPEAISPAFTITDTLPASMTYMPGTANVMFVSDSGITSNVPAVANLIGLKHVGKKVTCMAPKPTAVLPASQISPATFTPGVAPTFMLGTLTNNDADPDDEFVIIEFNALVNNLPMNVSALPNKDGVTLSNLFKVFIKGAPNPAATSNNADVQIVEPKLDVLKSASTASVNPNGVVTFTVTVKNNGSTDAFDVLITDPPAPGLSYVSGSAAVNSSCSSFTLNPLNGAVIVPKLPVGCTVTETYNANVTAQCPTASVTNTAFATYTSLPGPNGTPPGLTNLTGSSTPGGSGTVNGERQYTSQGAVTLPLNCTGSLTVTKTITNLTSVVLPPATTFPVNVSCTSGINVNLNLTIGSPTQTVPNIPSGSTCTITEGALPALSPNPVCASLQWGTPTYSPAQSVLIPTAGSTVAVQVQNTLFCNTCCATPPANMVSWWPLNETSGTTAVDIMGGNHGQTMSPTSVVAPMGSGSPNSLTGQHVNNSMNFVNTFVEANNSPSLNFGVGDFSIDAWVRSIPNGVTSQTNSIQPIVDKTGPGSSLSLVSGYALFISHSSNTNTGKLGFVIDDGTNPPVASTPVFHSAALSAGWYHVAVTVARTSATSAVVTLYVNGAASAPFTIAVGNTTNTSPLWIGKSRLYSILQAKFREVAIDEVEIFNRAITAAEVQQISNAGPIGKCQATISGMKFNDLNGNGVRDSGEPGITGWTIKITDANGNTHTAVTDASGNYSFTVPSPGIYTVSEVSQLGWVQTAPSSGTYVVSVPTGQAYPNKDFGNKKQIGCDLEIKKEMKPNPLVSGQPATATITVNNIGAGPCHGPTQVTESMPTGLTLVSATVVGGSCVLSTGVCNYAPAIPAGGSVVFIYVFNVTAQPGKSFENCAKLKNSEDTNPANNGACVPLTVSDSKLPDLTIQKKVQCGGPTIPQGTCNVTLTISNNSPGAFNGNLVIQDLVTPPPSPALSLIGSSPGWSCTTGPPNNISCATTSSVSLASGQNTTLSLSVKIPGGQFKNCASVKGYTQSPFTVSTLIQEGDLSNNESCVSMDVSGDCPTVPLRLFNTGAADNGSLLASGATDPHYVLLNTSPVSPNAFVLAASQIVGYVANSTTSQWLGPDPPGSNGGQGGFYTYRTTFNLDCDPSTAAISGQWSTDNEAEIFLNTLPTGVTTGASAFGALTPFVITSGFVSGVNTLDFRVRNRLSSQGARTPTGLHVQMNGTVKCCSATGSLTVTKTVENASPSPIPAGTSFPITVSCLPSGPNVTLNLAAGGTQTLNNIPVGSKCTVTEGPLPSHISSPACPSLQWTAPTYSPAQSVTIPNSGAPQTVTIQNRFLCGGRPPVDTYAFTRGMNEFCVWGGGGPGSYNSPTLIGNPDLPLGFNSQTLVRNTGSVRFGAIGLCYGRILSANGKVAFKYTFNATPAAVLSYPEFNPVFGPGEVFSVSQSRRNVFGGGLSPIGLQLYFRPQSRIKPFVSTSGGFIFFNDPVPRLNGAQFNFTYDFGGGVQVFHDANRAFTFGYKYQQISNGGRALNNPGFGGNVFSVGYSIFNGRKIESMYESGLTATPVLSGGPPPAPLGVHYVGIIPENSAGCPTGSYIRITMDDEDDKNKSSVNGWRGAISHYKSGTNFEFCKVDGDQFAGHPGGDYAVLKLSDTCPAGSISFSRVFDNEHNHNHNSKEGDITPNKYKPTTLMYFCFFPSAQTMTSFPDFGLPYGVFAAPSSAWLATGYVYTDDEDTDNKDYTTWEGIADTSRFTKIIYGSDRVLDEFDTYLLKGRNSYLLVAKVRN